MGNNCESNIVESSLNRVSDFLGYDSGEKLEYIHKGKKIVFNFFKDGLIKIDVDGKTKRLKVNLDQSNPNRTSKQDFNNTIGAALNIITDNDPNRNRIGKEVNNIYDLLTGRNEKETEIVECSISENSDLLDEIIDGGKIVRNFIVGLVQDIIFDIFGDNQDIMKISGKDLLKNKQFRHEIGSLSKGLQCKPLDLLIVMHAESRINPRAVNKISNATALIQFMPKTAKGLGTSVEELLSMSPVEQLKYVKIFLDQNDRGKTLDNTEKLYASVFYPTYLNHIDRNKSFVFGSESSLNRAQIVAKQNPAISRHSKRSDKLIDGYAFSRYVKEKKQDFRNAYNIA